MQGQARESGNFRLAPLDEELNMMQMQPSQLKRYKSPLRNLKQLKSNQKAVNMSPQPFIAIQNSAANSEMPIVKKI
jgi:hypothetical protein